MPLGDGTGPRGMGSMTGRGAGFCSGFTRPRYAGQLSGRGWFGFSRWLGLGASRGRGRGISRGIAGRGINRSQSYPRW